MTKGQRLKEIDKSFIEKHGADGYDVLWLIKELRSAWAQISIMKEALKTYSKYDSVYIKGEPACCGSTILVPDFGTVAKQALARVEKMEGEK